MLLMLLLKHGGAIALAAGKELQEESNLIIAQRKKPLDVGECVATDGYKLQCKIIHAVGPTFAAESQVEFRVLLKKTFLTAIMYADFRGAKTVAIPLISSGIFGGPKHLCAEALFDAVMEYSRNDRMKAIGQICLINIDDASTNAVLDAFQTMISGALRSASVPNDHK